MKATNKPLRTRNNLTDMHDEGLNLSGLVDRQHIQQMQKRLEESEHRFAELANATPVIIWMTGANKQHNYFNKAWQEFTGQPAEHTTDDSWIKNIHPDDQKQCLEVYAQALKDRAPFHIEYRLKRYDGIYRWVLDNGVPRFAGDHEFLGYIGSCVDIDEAKRGRELERMNTLLKRQRTQLVTLNNAKDEFISIASHQLRTPASAVKQYIGLLLEGYVGELTDMQLKMVKAAHDSNERQLSIIEALLRVAQVDAGRITLVKRTCDIVQLLADVIQEQQDKFKRRAQKILYEHPQLSVIASVDQRLLRMVLENIIDNASKYSQNGKCIKVILDRRSADIMLYVQDQGVGISIKDQKKLFQKFSRLNNPLSSLVSGSGLGLYWAKKIIDLHDGSISVESKEGKGSTFKITLPLQ